MAIVKQKKVGTIEHAKANISVDFFLRGTQFVATVLEKEFTAPDASVLRHKVNEHIEHWLNLNWHPVIEVDVSGSRYSGDSDNEVKIDFKRYYLSVGPAGGLATVDWDVDESHRKAKCEWSRRDDWRKLVKWPLEAPLEVGDEWLLPYSEETWSALENISDGIGKLKKAIRALISTRAGVAKLQSTGGKLLLTEGAR